MSKILMLAALTLSGCATKPAPLPLPVPALNIYEPPILVLPAGVPVMTEEGIYTPQTRVVFHSDARFRELERKGY